MGLAQKLFGTQSSKEIKRIMPLVHKIEGLRAQMMELSDEELRGKTTEFKRASGGRRDAGRPASGSICGCPRGFHDRVLKMEHYRGAADWRHHPASGTYRRDAYR